MNKKNIAFVGGGSGGHIQPIASLLDYAKQYTNLASQSNRYRFGQQGGLEETYAQRYDEVTFVSILTGKLRRYWTLQSTQQNIRDVFLIIGGFFQSVWKLKQYKIDAIFCKGGFVCPAVAYAGWLLRIPVIMHESDTHAGLANRMIVPIAKTVFVGFPGVTPREEVVGQILSPNLFNTQSVPIEGIDQSKTIILVMGGSQGAKVLFDAVYTIANTSDSPVQYVFLLGTKNQGGKDYTIEGQVWTLGFITQQQIAYLYEISDVAITRGSASSLQEQHIFGLKKAIVPLPHTGGDHQTVNAKWYQKQYGDEWIVQDEQLEESLRQFVQGLGGYKKVPKQPRVEDLCRASERIWGEIMGSE